MSPEKLEIELERLRAMKEYEYSFLSKNMTTSMMLPNSLRKI